MHENSAVVDVNEVEIKAISGFSNKAMHIISNKAVSIESKNSEELSVSDEIRLERDK